MLKVGILGFGYWGPNIVRNVLSMEGADVACICDIQPDVLKRAQAAYPHIPNTDSVEEIFQSGEIDLVAIITPLSTHYDLALRALQSGKNVFVEKPFTADSAQAQELIDLAEEKGLKIMVDHTFLFTGAVRKIKEVVDQGELGELYYYDATRVSLGLFQQDTNVIWDLAPHDFSIIDHIVGNKPVSITAHGVDHMGNNQENLAYITVFFERKMIAHINVNWLSPVKIRTTLIGGQKKMLVWDDLNKDERIKIYDKGVKVENKEGIYRLLVDYRAGDMVSPHIDQSEALKLELEYFRDCLLSGATPFNDGRAGLRVVKMLEAADASLKNQGEMIKL